VILVKVVLPTLAVAGTWLAVAALIAGCGALARRGLLAVASVPTCGRLRRADLWIGLASLTAFLQLWSLFAAISWAAWLVPVLAGAAGLAPSLRGLGVRLPLTVLAPFGVGLLWLANRALTAPSGYDFGLYHAAAVDYASRYAAIPGLGNLHDRLASGDAHFLVTALLGHLPGSGFQLVNGLLVAMLFADVAVRFAGRTRATFAFRMSLLAVPAAIVTAALDPSRLSEPNLDLSAFVLVVVGALYLAESVEGEFDATAATTCIATLALAAVHRPLFWLTAVVALGLLVVRAPPRRRTLLGLLIAPAALALGWTARQAVLSGYPLFPLTFVRLPVDWRMPAANVDELARWIRSWARSGENPDFARDAWLGQWLREELTSYDVLVPLLLLGAALVALLVRGRVTRRAQAPLLAIVLSCAVTLVAWFLIAPAPRFALAPIWLIPLALAAWALPESLPSSLQPRMLAGATAIVVALGVGVVAVASKRAFVPIAARGEAATSPPVRLFRTSSGLVLWRPADGSDQCWSVRLCTPWPSRALRLRGTSLQSGFRMVQRIPAVPLHKADFRRR
jgi:hypothetical protein